MTLKENLSQTVWPCLGVKKEYLPDQSTQLSLLNSLHAHNIYFPSKGCVPIGLEQLTLKNNDKDQWWMRGTCPTCGKVLNEDGDEFDFMFLMVGVDGGRY